MVTLTPQPWKYKVVKRTFHNTQTQKEQDYLDSEGGDDWMLCEVRQVNAQGAKWYYFMKPA